MAHFAYTRLGGIWASLTDISAADLQSLDAKTFKAINGDDGGVWAPSSQIVVGGSGFSLTGPIVVESGGTWDVKAGASGFIRNATVVTGSIETSGSGRLKLGAGDYVEFTSTRTRTVVQPLIASPYLANSWGASADAGAATTPAPDYPRVTGPGPGGISQRFLLTNVHDGAHLIKVRLHVKLAAHAGSAPQFTPFFYVVRYNLATQTGSAMASAGTASLGNGGGVGPTYAAQTSWDLTVDGAGSNNHIIDRSSYVYLLGIVDESGTSAVGGNQYLGATLFFDSIADTRPQ